VNNIEGMMSELVKSSVNLKHKLYRRDESASTTPEGMEGPRISVHTCRLCNRAAAGEGAQVSHKADCPLPRLQRAQKALREAWPELFTPKPAPAVLAAAPLPSAPPAKCVAHLSGDDPVASAPSSAEFPAYFPPPPPRATRLKGRGHIGRVAGSKTWGPESRSTANGSPSAQTGSDARPRVGT
jgi:hypothetical protein